MRTLSHSLLLLIAFSASSASNLLAQANLGPILTPRLNQTWYAGSPQTPSFQSAVTAACASTAGGHVVKTFGMTTSDTVGTVTGGCNAVDVEDQSATNPVLYTWNAIAGAYALLPQPSSFSNVTAATYTVPVGMQFVSLSGSAAQTVTLPTLTATQLLGVTLIFRGVANDTVVAPSGSIYLNNVSFGSSAVIPLTYVGPIALMWDGTNWWSVSALPELETVTAAVGTGAGTVSTALAVAANSSPSRGSLTFTTITAGTAGGTIFTVTFSKTLAHVFAGCQPIPTTANAGLYLTYLHQGTVSTTTFSFVDGATALPAGSYGFAWSCQ